MWVSSLTLQSHWGNLPPNNNSSTHNSHLLEEWLSRQADLELSDWPPRSPDLNTMNVNVKGDEKKMQDAWPDLPRGCTDVTCILVSDNLNEPEAIHSQLCVPYLIKSIGR